MESFAAHVLRPLIVTQSYEFRMAQMIDVGPVRVLNLRDELGLVNGFGELYDTTETTKTGVRAGRQEIFFGNDLQAPFIEHPGVVPMKFDDKGRLRPDLLYGKTAAQ